MLAELGRAGIRDDDITVVFGLGSHRAHTPQERAQLAGDAVSRRVHCTDSDPNDVAVIGHTNRGTPVAVFRPVLAADVRVCLGVIEYHYFAGYSGGYKTVIPGVAGLETIQRNHCMMTQPEARAGKLTGNPVREDIDEAGAMVGVDFILNVILDEAHQIVSAVAGHPQLAHHEGWPGWTPSAAPPWISRPMWSWSARAVCRGTSTCTRRRRRWRMPGTSSGQAA